jgi:hypothetical protein
MHIPMILFRAFIALMMTFAPGCSRSRTDEYKLTRWPDGMIDRYAIEFPQLKESHVVFPDVRALQTVKHFVLGRGYWKYLDDSYPNANGSLITNEFWFVLDKRMSYPKCYATISTNKEFWIAWCISHNVPTNIVEIEEFVRLRSASGGGGMPPL